MAGTMTATEFHALGLDDWHFVLRRIEARFRAGSFGSAAALVAAVADAADAADHHPDVDLRPPGVVRVALSSHDAGGVTQRDVDLATTVSGLAAEAGLVAEPTGASRQEVAIDALDIPAVLPFWAAVLGYREGPPGPDGTVDEVVDPLGIGPTYWFQQMEAPRPQRNRIHIDVTVHHDVARDRLEATLAAGGRLLSDEAAPAFWVLADAEGNEACICTWQGRDTLE